MHALFLHAQANISAEFRELRDIKVSMESGDHAGPLLAHNMNLARKLVCMHAMCLCAQAHISAKLGQIREVKVYMDSG